ncbi:uncharacterized protein LOC142240806 [Haematobia irritans]|uniref:uncharacterized protein LOC142240806 n=1 Tax=Haematobia irritans TaxID=7368 RepID=UPI003F4FE327
MLHEGILYTIITVCLLATSICSTDDRTLALEIRNITCVKFTNLLQSIECEYHKIAIDDYGFSVRYSFTRDMASSLIARFVIDIKPEILNKEIRLIDYRINSCILLKQKTSQWFMKRFLNEFKRTNNLPTSCPLKANFVYRMDNFTVNSDWIPRMLTLSDFIFTIELYNRQQRIGMWTIYGGVV